MKAILYSTIFALLAATPGFGQEVSLVGTWTGQRDRIAKVEGRRGGLATVVITWHYENLGECRLFSSRRPRAYRSRRSVGARRSGLQAHSRQNQICKPIWIELASFPNFDDIFCADCSQRIIGAGKTQFFANAVICHCHGLDRFRLEYRFRLAEQSH